MKITKNNFGLLSNGEKVFLYTLKAGDLELSLSSFGAAWTRRAKVSVTTN